MGKDNIYFIPTSTIAKKILGDSIAANIFIIGYAYQAGLIPIKGKPILHHIIEYFNVSVNLNLNAFKLGRQSFVKKNEIINFLGSDNISNSSQYISSKLEEKISRRYDYLIEYQNKKYAEKYLKLVNIVKNYENKLNIQKSFLTEAVAVNYFKLMAYKDEYEVSRLYTDVQFKKNIYDNFEGDFTVNFHISPPFFSKKDSVTGTPLKITIGSWLMPLMKIISSFKFLRGTPFDPFGYL